MRLSAEKLHVLKIEILGWSTKKKTTKKVLLSIIGKLAFAVKVVKPGRIFRFSMVAFIYRVLEHGQHYYRQTYHI